MTNLEKYLEKLALRPYVTKTGKYHLPSLLALQMSHLPRLSEIIRVFLKQVKVTSESYPDDYTEDVAEIINKAMVAMNEAEDLALDGMSMMCYEIGEVKDDRN